MKPPIIVTGCQRSGTRITAHILAHDFELTYVDELEVDFYNLQPNTVVQSPLALHGYLQAYYTYPGIHFVGVLRNPQEIIASMKRINWLKGDVTNWEAFLTHYVGHQQRLWKQLTKELPNKSWSEIEYDSLKTHPLFVKAKDRQDFTSLQWQKGIPNGPTTWENNLDCLYAMKTS